MGKERKISLQILPDIPCRVHKYGFIYDLTDGKNRVIYAEELFCNSYMDLKYQQHIPEEYLLDGFDATENNPVAVERRKNLGG